MDIISDTAEMISTLGVANSSAVRHPAGTVILSRTASVGFSAILGADMATSQDFATWTCSSRLDSKYLLYALRAMAPDLRRLATGSTHKTIYMPDIAQLRIPVPPFVEQRRIVDFLDAETAHIDRLRTLRTAQLDALEVRELSLIRDSFGSQRGTVAVQSTPWPWLAEIPSGWHIGPVHAYFSTELGKMLNSERSAGSNLAPYLRNANVHWYDISTDDMAAMNFEAGERYRYSVVAGDLLVCEGGAGVAEAAVWDGRIERCYFQKSLHRVRATRNVPVEWLMYWLRLAKYVGHFDAEGNLSTIPHLTGEQLRALRFPIPPDSQQRVDALNEGVRLLETVRATVRRADTLLRERRQALITAAVTGRLDVTKARGANLS